MTTSWPAASTPRLFDLSLPPLKLARGDSVESHHARGWWWGPEADLPALEARTRRLSTDSLRSAQGQEPVRRTVLPEPLPPAGPRFTAEVPTVLLVHALTGDARAGGESGWWEPLVGPGRVLDPSRHRILCLNNLGSCYGSSGPLDPGFPQGEDVLTPWDQAAAQLQALDALGIGRLALVVGGSVGGMIALCMAALAPKRVPRLMPIAVSATTSAWVVGWNHVARQLLRLDTGAEGRGLELARQLATLTYRAEPGLELRQGRHLPPVSGSGAPRIQSYLEHQGAKLRARFDTRSYLQHLGTMDAHDLLQPPPGEPGLPGLARIRASTLAVDVDTDQLFTPAQVQHLADALAAAGAHVERATLKSAHGHDAFLIEWDALAPMVARALTLPEPSHDARK